MRDRDYISDVPVSADSSRFWCSYLELEEYHAGMWRHAPATKERTMIAQSVALLRDETAFSAALSRVCSEWPVSCLAEFTSPGNHLAWLGCAACCLAHGAPESLTRRAWWKLTNQQRDTANRVASDSILSWTKKHLHDSGATKTRLRNITLGCGAGLQTRLSARRDWAQLPLFSTAVTEVTKERDRC